MTSAALGAPARPAEAAVKALRLSCLLETLDALASAIISEVLAELTEAFEETTS